MQSIVSSIKANDVVSPLRLLLNERAKQRDCGRTRFHSIYRDILFLSFVALGRDCIDHGLLLSGHTPWKHVVVVVVVVYLHDNSNIQMPN